MCEFSFCTLSQWLRVEFPKVYMRFSFIMGFSVKEFTKFFQLKKGEEKTNENSEETIVSYFRFSFNVNYRCYANNCFPSSFWSVLTYCSGHPFLYLCSAKSSRKRSGNFRCRLGLSTAIEHFRYL